MKKYFQQLALALSILLLFPRPSEGQVGNNSPTGVGGDWNGSVTTGCSIDPFTGNARRVVDDIVVAGSVGAYPLKWTRTLNTRNSGRRTDFGHGGSWTHSYHWGLAISTEFIINYPDGRIVQSVNGGAMAGHEPLDRLVAGTPEGIDLVLRDGGKVEFRTPRRLATAIVDPYGQRTLLEYDQTPGFEDRLIKVTEPAGRYLQIYYERTSWIVPNPLPPPDTLEVHFDVIVRVDAYDRIGGSLLERVDYAYNRGTGSQNTPYAELTQVDYATETQHANYTYFDTTHLMKTCDDLRAIGPMKKISYEYASGSGVEQGQVKKEKTFNGQQTLTEIIYPVGNNPPNPYDRTEIRPDGSTRLFKYREFGGILESYTDFEQHTSVLYEDYSPGWPDLSYFKTFQDARGPYYTTRTDHEPVIGAVKKLTHPDGSTVEYKYWDDANPYYIKWRKDERGKTTYYNRDGQNRIDRIDYPDGGYETFRYNPFGQVIEHLLTSGGTEFFSYDFRGLKQTYTPPSTSSHPNPSPSPTRYTYYENEGGRPDRIDRLKTVTDPRGHVTEYDYNRRGQVTRVTHHNGSYVPQSPYTLSEYNDDGTLLWTEDELRQRTKYEYDDYKRVTKVTNPLEQFIQNDYTPLRGNLSPLSHTTSSIYRVTSFLNKKTEHDYDDNFRRFKTVQAPATEDEATTEFTYDEVGNLRTTKDPRNKITTYGYNYRNQQTSVRNDELNETTVFEYDVAGNKEKETRPDLVFRSWDYDSMNRLWHAYDWRRNPTPTLAQTTTYQRDYAGNAYLITDTKGAVYEFEYDDLNRKTKAIYPEDANGFSSNETWYYDWAGNMNRYKNPAGQTKHIEHDFRNRPWHSWWIGNNAGQEIVTVYDKAGRVTSITTNNGETTVAFGYDPANRKLWEDQTVAGQPTRRVKTVLDGDGRRSTLQIVDPPQEGGNLVISMEMQDSGSYSVEYLYTERNQVERIQTADGAWAFNYTYDQSGNMTTRRTESTRGNSSTNCPTGNYDALNRPMTWEHVGPNGPFSRSHYRYDRANRQRAVWREENGNRGERFAYEATNQLKSAIYNANPPAQTPTPPPGQTPTPSPGQTPTPPPGQQVDMPTFSPDAGDYCPNFPMDVWISTETSGAHIGWTKDGSAPIVIDGILTHGTLIAGESGWITLSVNEINQSVILSAIAFMPNGAASTVNIGTYYCDEGDAPGAGSRMVTYNYTLDKLNRSSVRDINGIEISYSPNQLNQYTSVGGSAYLYDNNFNLTRTEAFNGVYDAANRLVSASNSGGSIPAAFVYDGLGRCVKRTIDSVATIFVYDGWKPITEWYEEKPEYFEVWNIYGPGADEILLRHQGKYGYLRYHLDRHGNVAFLLDGDGALIEKYTYDAFGRPTVTGSGGGARESSYYSQYFLFQGREYIRELGIYDYRNRFYYPALGRFLQTDPIGFTAGDMNLFRYVGDDPVNKSDPTGLDTLLIFGQWYLSDYRSWGGHVSIATTGQGLQSAGNNPTDSGPGRTYNHSHASVTKFLAEQSKVRNQKLLVLKTTSREERIINSHMDSRADKNAGKLHDNCAERVTGALKAAGVINRTAKSPDGAYVLTRNRAEHRSVIRKGDSEQAEDFRSYDPPPPQAQANPVEKDNLDAASLDTELIALWGLTPANGMRAPLIGSPP